MSKQLTESNEISLKLKPVFEETFYSLWPTCRQWWKKVKGSQASPHWVGAKTKNILLERICVKAWLDHRLKNHAVLDKTSIVPPSSSDRNLKIQTLSSASRSWATASNGDSAIFPSSPWLLIQLLLQAFCLQCFPSCLPFQPNLPRDSGTQPIILLGAPLEFYLLLQHSSCLSSPLHSITVILVHACIAVLKCQSGLQLVFLSRFILF